MKLVYFFDTYAFFEIIAGNPAYEKFKDVQAITTIFNLAELNYGLKKEKGRAAADECTEKYMDFLVDVSLDDVKKAMDLKLQRKHLSIPDAVGYTIAKRYQATFLTGDGDFKDMPNVELVR
ncbi:MAG TPA: PIN domain-containing protein [Candidatus Nanoarchaeia archaeon]|nr:PIN domain-containing protein [Candidatus Nanoarchaeia archaeon]